MATKRQIDSNTLSPRNALKGRAWPLIHDWHCFLSETTLFPSSSCCDAAMERDETHAWGREQVILLPV
jgi:hypothetical protein